MGIGQTGFPRQKLPYSRKNTEWRKSHLDWADKNSYLFNSEVRKSLKSKKINLDLWNGVLHEDDLKKVLNPLQKRIGYIPKEIQHYPILNNPLNTLIGEEARLKYDFFAKVCNDEAVSSIEENKTKEALQQLASIITSEDLSEDEVNQKIEDLGYSNYRWQDLRELRANWLLKHYMSILDFDRKMNQGFKDVLIYGEEMYQFSIVGNEPVFEVLNPRKVYTLRSGYSSKIEDADIIIIDDYWSPSKVLDYYYNDLKDADVEYIETVTNASISQTDNMGNLDERSSFLYTPLITEQVTENAIDSFVWLGNNFSGLPGSNYIDNAGNLRVLRIYWKSKRKVKKVKSYDPVTGAEVYNFRDEYYKIDPFLGEEEEVLWINEIWKGAKIGKEIYVDMKPSEVQYLRLNNPSVCHAGIIGQVYNTGQSKPVSLLDRLKPYQYLYDAIKDRLNKTIAKNYGKILEMDKAKMPAGWDYQKWLYFIEQDNISVVDSFKEGNKGQATGKLAGNFNTSGRGLDMEVGNSIQMYINLLEYLKNEMYEISGVSKQRQGQIANRETVGGVERAVSQSATITEEIFSIHTNVRKRCLITLLETAKMALKGNNKKIQYITDDRITKILDIDGDEFAEYDYDIVIDNDLGDRELKQKLEVLAQAALQNQTLNFSTIMKIFTSTSLSSVMRTIERDERKKDELNSQQFQLQKQQMEEQMQYNRAKDQALLDLEDKKNQRDNDTKLQIATLTAKGEGESSKFEELALKRDKLDKDHNIKIESIKETARHNKEMESISKSKTNKK